MNAELARRRAAQLEHVHLAAIYARLGFPEAAAEEADVVPAASARMWCQIENRLTACDLALSAGDLERTSLLLQEVGDWIQRGIACGAIVDPWNILGFDANFSLFPALENSVHDHRVDELVALMEQVFALESRLWSEAAARDEPGVVAQCFRAVPRHGQLVAEVRGARGLRRRSHRPGRSVSGRPTRGRGAAPVAQGRRGRRGRAVLGAPRGRVRFAESLRAGRPRAVGTR